MSDVGRPEEAVRVLRDQRFLGTRRCRAPEREMICSVVMIVQRDELSLTPHEPTRLAVTAAFGHLGQCETERPKPVHRVAHALIAAPVSASTEHDTVAGRRERCMEVVGVKRWACEPAQVSAVRIHQVKGGLCLTVGVAVEEDLPTVRGVVRPCCTESHGSEAAQVAAIRARRVDREVLDTATGSR